VAAYTICNKYERYCMDIWILYRGSIEYIQGWTYPLLKLLVRWSLTLLECCDVSVVLLKASEANEVRRAVRR
jgi:hypothetical protein